MRKSTVVIAPKWEGRDDGRHYLLTEMSAERAEDWALQMFIAAKGTSAEVPAEVARLGMVGVFIRGLNSFLAADVKFSEIKPLLDEMMACVKIIRDPQRFPDVATPLMEDDIEEVATRAWLRAEVLSLHTGFSVVDAFWDFVALLKTPSQDSSTPSTSPSSPPQ